MCGLVRLEITKSRLFSLCTKVTVCYMCLKVIINGGVVCSLYKVYIVGKIVCF
jgi:hypothetical protein